MAEVRDRERNLMICDWLQIYTCDWCFLIAVIGTMEYFRPELQFRRARQSESAETWPETADITLMYKLARSFLTTS